jgi:membrane protease YdiL (CAAX protease family)
VLPPRPWTIDTLTRLAVGVLLCVLAGTTLAGATRYDPASAKLAAHWFYLLILAGMGAFLAALVLLLREWTVEALMPRAAVFLVLLFIGLNLGLVAGKLGGDASDAPPGLAQIVIATLALQGASLVLVAWFLRRNAMRWRHAFGLKHRPWLAAAKGLLLGLLALPVLWFMQPQCAELLRKVGWEPQQQTMVEVFQQMHSLPGKLYLGFAALVLAPFTEEILFRGLLYPALKQFIRRDVALALAALLFAALHSNAASFLPLVLLALALALLYDHTQNLLAPIAAHATFNTGNVVLLLVMQSLGYTK